MSMSTHPNDPCVTVPRPPINHHRTPRLSCFPDRPTRAATLWHLVPWPLVLLTFSSVCLATGIPESERAALIAFYQSTGGENWTHQDNWLGAAGTESEWFGVQVQNGHVIAISMENGNMQGEIPADLVDLPYMETLELVGGNPLLSGDPQGTPNWLSLAPEIGDLASLRDLTIISGTLESIPDSIGNLANLETLDLEDNELTALPESLGGLGSLQTLILSHNEIGEIGAWIGQLSLLVTLEASFNPLEALPPEIGQLGNLEVLYLSGDQLQELPSTIGGLQKLTQLVLYYNHLVSLPTSFWDLTNLVRLNLSSNRLVSLPDSIGNLTQLQDLDLMFNRLATLPPGIGSLTALERLFLPDNVLAALPPEFGQLRSLSTLNLGWNQLTDLPAEFGNLQALESLDLQYNQLPAVPAPLFQLTGLTDLDLRGNRIAGHLTPEIGQMTGLLMLDLSQNQLTGTLPDELRNLTGLQVLNLDWNALRAQGEEMISYLLSRIEGGYPHWRSTQAGPPAFVDYRVINANTVEIWWTQTPKATDTIAVYYSSATSADAALMPAFIEVPADREAVKIARLDVGKDYRFALRGVAYPNFDHFNRVESDPTRVLEYSTPSVLPIYFPMVESSLGKYTGISVTNPSAKPAHLEFSALGTDGEVLPLTQNPATLMVPAHAQRAMLVRELLQSVPSTPFWVRMTTDNAQVAALSVIGDYRMTELDGYLPMQLSSQELEFARVYEGANSLAGRTAQTRLALVNPGPDPISIRLMLRGPAVSDQSGRASLQSDEPLVEPRTFSVASGGMLRGSLSELFGQSLTISSGDLAVETIEGEGVVGAALIEFPGTLMAIAGEPPTVAQHAYAPTVSLGTSNALEVFSNLKLINELDSSDNATIWARASEGFPLGITQVDLAPGSSLEGDVAELLNIELTSNTLYNASLYVDFATPSGPANLIVGEKSRLRYATAFPLQTRPFTEAIFSHLASTPAIFTGISLFNPDPQELTFATVEVYDDEGQLLADKTVYLTPYRKVSRLVSELFGDLEPKTAGYIRILADRPIVAAQIFADWDLNYYCVVPPDLVLPSPIDGAFVIAP